MDYYSSSLLCPPTHIPETAWAVVEGTQLWFLAPVIVCIYLNYMKGQKDRDKCDWSGREAELTEAAGPRPASVVSELLTGSWWSDLSVCMVVPPPFPLLPSSAISQLFVAGE